MICSFYLKKRFIHEREVIYNLNQNYESEDKKYGYKDFISMIIDFFKKHENYSDDEKGMKLFSINHNSLEIHEEETYRAITFEISSGAYGIESKITDRQSKKIKYLRTANDADIKDFMCTIYIPKDINDLTITKGMLIFQTLGTYGVKTITTKQMKEFFAELGLTLEIRSVSVRTFIEKLVELGNLHRVTLIKNHISPDLSDNMFIATGREERTYIKPKLKNEWFNRFLNFIDNKSDTDIFEINNESYENIKITFKLGNNYRTVGLMEIDKFSVVEDIPHKIYKNGKYDKKELLMYMIDTANTYKEKMVFTVKNGG